jgi:hypothetical protein
MLHTTDPLELRIIKLLDYKNIAFIHESQTSFPRKNGRSLDFYLPDFDLYIEVKAFHTERINKQLGAYANENIILIIQEASILFLEKLCQITNK